MTVTLFPVAPLTLQRMASGREVISESYVTFGGVGTGKGLGDVQPAMPAMMISKGTSGSLFQILLTRFSQSHQRPIGLV